MIDIEQIEHLFYTLYHIKGAGALEELCVVIEQHLYRYLRHKFCGQLLNKRTKMEMLSHVQRLLGLMKANSLIVNSNAFISEDFDSIRIDFTNKPDFTTYKIEVPFSIKCNEYNWDINSPHARKRVNLLLNSK